MTLLAFVFEIAVSLLCHPERDAFCLAKDLGAPREPPALSAGGQIARLARILITDRSNHGVASDEPEKAALKAKASFSRK